MFFWTSFCLPHTDRHRSQASERAALAAAALAQVLQGEGMLSKGEAEAGSGGAGGGGCGWFGSFLVLGDGFFLCFPKFYIGFLGFFIGSF